MVTSVGVSLSVMLTEPPPDAQFFKVFTETFIRWYLKLEKMPRTQWKPKRIIGITLLILLVYLTLRIKTYDHKASVFLRKTNAIHAWEYVADFSNMKFLNPTIMAFDIISDEGNYDHWKYTTKYSEILSHWPHLPNYAVAHFNVKAGPKKDVFYIDSVHTTCMLNNLFCLESTSEFKFVNSNTSDGAVCEESITYQCPAFLSVFCRREVTFQRTAIMNNLKKHFLKGS